MQIKDTNTEQAILDAAMIEFLDKGYARTKTTEIAKRAGVNHAMLHYYFRTKENLFNVVFQQKLQLLASSFTSTFNQDMPFFDQIKEAVENHFDFIDENPKLLFFIYSEVINNDERKLLLIKSLLPRVSTLLSKLKESIAEEIKKGTIEPIEPIELIMNIVSLNIVTFLAMPILGVLEDNTSFEIKNILRKRKENNVKFVINGLKK